MDSDLNMYLLKKYYVKNWEHTPDEERYSIDIKRGDASSPIPVKQIIFVDAEKIHWENALPIHNWFAKNVQNGINNKKYYSVDETKLRELVRLIDSIIEDNSKADKFLPCPEKRYDADYFALLEFTKTKLVQALEIEEEEGEFFYMVIE